jgi:hypothetical protein
MVARAREKGRLDAEYAGRLSELLAPHLPAAVQAWVDGLQANKAIWSKELKDFVETNVPDHKVRAECALYLIHYAVGKAIERTLGVTGSYKELSDVLAELRQSPEARRLLPRELFDTLQTAVEDKESPPAHAGNTSQDSSQKTG